MPIRSSEARLPRAWALIRDIGDPQNLLFYRSPGHVSKPQGAAGSNSAKCHLPIEYAADLTPVEAGKEAGASWNPRGVENALDFWSWKEYSVRASGRTPGKIAGRNEGQARRLDQLVLGETERNQ